MHITEQFRNNGWGKSSLGVTARTTPPHHHATTPPSTGLCVREISCRGMFYFAIVARAKEPKAFVTRLTTGRTLMWRHFRLNSSTHVLPNQHPQLSLFLVRCSMPPPPSPFYCSLFLSVDSNLS